MIWNNVAERANSMFLERFREKEIGFVIMQSRSITHWKWNTAILAMIGGEEMNEQLSIMVHHRYIGLGNFCERCGRRLDWGEYHK